MEYEGNVPRQAIAYLEAVRRYYQPGVTRLPRNADIAAAHHPRLNSRTWDRRKSDLRDGKLGRDWIEVWPPPPGWRPTWEDMLTEAQLVAATAEGQDGLVHLSFDESYDPRNGKLVERRLVRTLGHLGSVAAGYAYLVFDMSDGRLDGTFRALRFSSRVLEDMGTAFCRILT